MSARRFIPAVLAGFALIVATLDSSGGPVPEDPALMVVDLHVDVPWQVHFKKRAPSLTEGHASLAALTRGGYGGIVFPIYLPDSAHKDGAHI